MKINRSKLAAKVLALIIIIVLGVFALTACDFISSINEPYNTDITVYIDNVPKTYEAIFGQRLDLGVLVKPGYMIKDVTDETGRVYFDYTGKSLTDWDKSNPTVFYANFIPVGNLSYQYTSVNWTDAERVSGIGWDTLSYTYGEVMKQFHSALMGNPLRKVKMTVAYRERGEKSSGNLYFRVYVNSDELVYSTSTSYVGEVYITTTQEITLDASLLVNGFKLSWAGDQWYFFHYVKDVNVKLEFV